MGNLVHLRGVCTEYTPRNMCKHLTSQLATGLIESLLCSLWSDVLLCCLLVIDQLPCARKTPVCMCCVVDMLWACCVCVCVPVVCVACMLCACVCVTLPRQLRTLPIVKVQYVRCRVHISDILFSPPQ